LLFALRVAGFERGRGAKGEAFVDQWFGLLRRASLGHRDVTSAKVAGVKFAQGCRRQLRGGHGDKGVASRLVRGRIELQLDVDDGAYPGEEKSEVSFSNDGGKVADV